MANLTTTYLGLELNNPVMVSSSGLTGSIDGIKKSADNGAGAVILKSLFEEIIVAQNEELEQAIIQTEHPEAYGYIEAELGIQMGTKPYLRFIEDARKATDIPVIASVNCTSARWWVSYAKDLESAGAHALELNISHFPQQTGEEAIEQRYADIVAEVTGRVDIPVAVKIGDSFTTLWDTLRKIADAGASGLVLFNRSYGIDIDLKSRQFVPAMSFSAPEEMVNTLRWVGLASDALFCDISASTGIHDAKSALKMIMAGATTVQVCSAIYKNGFGYLAEMIEDMDAWLEKECIASVEDLRGIAHKNTADEDVLLHRLQYLKALNEASKYEM